MVRMVGFRNVIVRECARVGAEIVVRIPGERLDDFSHFSATARSWA
jgi:uncharacterized protein YutE (UPF0331/DUF86 family)